MPAQMTQQTCLARVFGMHGSEGQEQDFQVCSKNKIMQTHRDFLLTLYLPNSFSRHLGLAFFVYRLNVATLIRIFLSLL